MDKRIVPASSSPQPSCAYRAVFFDLDGTLLSIDTEKFLNTYMDALVEFVSQRTNDAADFLLGLGAGMDAMVTHNDARTNEEVFWESFFAHVKGDHREWKSLLEEFYEYNFGSIGKDITAHPAALRAVKCLVEKGYPLVLATMPMFPHRAVTWRLEWAGIEAKYFSRLTCFENSTAVKPDIEYYSENLKAVDLKGSEVLMVGNNTLDDLTPLSLGADAFLVTDYLLNPIDFALDTVKHGTMEEFAVWVETLPPCLNPATSFQQGVIEREGA